VRRLLSISCLLLAVLAGSAEAREPTARAPIVVGPDVISLGALDARSKQARETFADPEVSRQAAAGSLISEAVLAQEARRRRVPLRGLSDFGSEAAVGRAIAGRVRGAQSFVARFRAFERRWHATVRCTPRWSITVPCRTPEELGEITCLWTGAADLCTTPPAPGQDRFWSVGLSPERFGLTSEDGAGVLRPLRRRIARIPGLRARLGEFVDEGEVTVFAKDERAAELVAREAFLLQRTLRPR
jgi:hypothetical protein